MLKTLPGSTVVSSAVSAIQSTARKVLNPCDCDSLPTVMEVFRTAAGDWCLISPCQFSVPAMEYVIDFNFADPTTKLPGRMVLRHPDDENFPPCIELREIDFFLGSLKAKEEGFYLVSLRETSERPEWAGRPRDQEPSPEPAKSASGAESRATGRFQRQTEATLVTANH
ncbi:MAG TPA: hypothetical protein VNA68_00130 [Candidatus Dormibacteraeota bacterium]|nr:hypothetical protein [Candidatus Dormibacteraeota bacterium]